MLFQCYRKDEVHDSEVYVAAVAATLSEWPKAVIDYVTDPRTGIPSESKWVPNVAEVRAACSKEASRRDVLSKPSVVFDHSTPPPPVKPGQIDSKEFNRRVAAGELNPRPIGRFETVGDKWNRHWHLPVGGKQ